MKKIRIISMDFDGTLLTSNKKLTTRTRECLINLKNKSYLIIGITARNILSVKGVLDVYMFDYIILNNGTEIYYVKEDKIENISSINKDIARKIYNLYDGNAYKIDFCTTYNYFMKSKEKSDNRPFVKYINDIDEVKGSILRINVFFNDAEQLETNKKLIESTFDCIDVVRMVGTDKLNSPVWLTINPKNINKLSALKKICNDIECSIDEVIFFGDSENDLILIENAGIGVAMGNALEIVKEKAAYTTLSNDDDGIAEYLEKLNNK